MPQGAKLLPSDAARQACLLVNFRRKACLVHWVSGAHLIQDELEGRRKRLLEGIPILSENRSVSGAWSAVQQGVL